MKLLHLTDLHGHLPWYHFLAREASKYNLVCISGDLIELDDSAPGQIAAVTDILASIRCPIAICSGNHDTIHAKHSPMGQYWVADLKREGVCVDKGQTKSGDWLVYCHPWLEPMRTAGPREIWLAHAPPERTATSQHALSGADSGDHEFAELCRTGAGPAIALCGHAHHPRHWHATLGRTLVLNPGRSTDPRTPAYIVLDLERKTATRHFPELEPETIQLPGQRAGRIHRRRTAEQIEFLLALAISNQRAEGIHMTVAEIEETRRRLREHFESES